MVMIKNKKPLMTADDEPAPEIKSGPQDDTVIEGKVTGTAALLTDKPPSGFAGKGQTKVTHPTGAVEETQHDIPGELLSVQGMEPMAYPSLRLGQTLNLGNYNSLRIEVGLSLPCKPEDLDATYDYAFGWVDERFSGLLTQAKDAYGIKD